MRSKTGMNESTPMPEERSRLAEFVSAAAALFPFMLGPLLVPFTVSSEGDVALLSIFLSQYLCWLLLFGSWSVLCSAVERSAPLQLPTLPRYTLSKRARRDKASAQAAERPVWVLKLAALTSRWGKTALVLCASLTTIVLMQRYRSSSTSLQFALALLAFALSAMSGALEKRARAGDRLALALLGVSTNIGYRTLIGFLGIELTIDAFSPLSGVRWQSAVAAIGPACALALIPLSEVMILLAGRFAALAPRDREKSSLRRDLRISSRVYNLLSLLAPFSSAALVYADQLPPRYLAVFIILALSWRGAEGVSMFERSGTLPKRFRLHSAGIPVLYMLIILLLAMV